MRKLLSPNLWFPLIIHLRQVNQPLFQFQSYVRMSTQASISDPTPQDSSEPLSSKPILALPAPGESTHQLDVSGSGSTVSLDHLGPIVVNVDGTLARITNWHEMTDMERRNTGVVVAKRNIQRLEALKAKGVDVNFNGNNETAT